MGSCMAFPYSVPDVETKSTMPIRLAFHFLQLSLHRVLYSSFTSFFVAFLFHVAYSDDFYE